MCQYWQTIYNMNGISMFSSKKLNLKYPKYQDTPMFDVFDKVNNYRSVPNFTKIKKISMLSLPGQADRILCQYKAQFGMDYGQLAPKTTLPKITRLKENGP